MLDIETEILMNLQCRNHKDFMMRVLNFHCRLIIDLFQKKTILIILEYK